MTTRNVDDPDRNLDLSLFMPFIGSAGDGGHKEAASCKPSQNEAFDKDTFERVNSANFLDYGQYIASKVAEFTNMELKKVSKIGS